MRAPAPEGPGEARRTAASIRAPCSTSMSTDFAPAGGQPHAAPVRRVAPSMDARDAPGGADRPDAHRGRTPAVPPAVPRRPPRPPAGDRSTRSCAGPTPTRGSTTSRPCSPRSSAARTTTPAPSSTRRTSSCAAGARQDAGAARRRLPRPARDGEQRAGPAAIASLLPPGTPDAAVAPRSGRCAAAGSSCTATIRSSPSPEAPARWGGGAARGGGRHAGGDGGGGGARRGGLLHPGCQRQPARVATDGEPDLQRADRPRHRLDPAAGRSAAGAARRRAGAGGCRRGSWHRSTCRRSSPGVHGQLPRHLGDGRPRQRRDLGLPHRPHRLAAASVHRRPEQLAIRATR